MLKCANFSGHSLSSTAGCCQRFAQVMEIGKRAVIEAVKQAGAKEVYLVENSIAGALGY